MKVRTGFVSNSSSSSFVVAIDKDKIPTTEAEILATLDDADPWKAATILHEIQDQPHLLIKNDGRTKLARRINDILWEMYDGHSDRIDNDPRLNEARDAVKLADAMWDSYEDKEDSRRMLSEAYTQFTFIQNTLKKEVHEDFLKVHEGKVALFFEYCDNDGPKWDELEHNSNSWDWVIQGGGEAIQRSDH